MRDLCGAVLSGAYVYVIGVRVGETAGGVIGDGKYDTIFAMAQSASIHTYPMPDALIFLIGLAIGSFLNVVIDRIPLGEDIIYGRSHCDHCKRVLRWFELIPVLSFVLQKGACRRCGRRLSFQYPCIELAGGIAFLLVYRSVSSQALGLWFVPVLLSSWAAASVLTALAVIDWKHQIIPDVLLWVGWIVSLPLIAVRGTVGAANAVVTAVVSFGFFYALWKLTKGRGMGYGDVKLALYLGAVAGYPMALIGFYLAFLTGAIYGVILMIAGRAGMKSRIAFGPFMIGGVAAAFSVGSMILRQLGII